MLMKWPLVFGTGLVTLVALSGCGTADTHVASAQSPQKKQASSATKHVKPTPSQRPPITTTVGKAHQYAPGATVPLVQAPLQDFSPLMIAVFHALKPLTSVPLVGPTSPPSDVQYASIKITSHGYDVIWYGSPAASAFSNSSVIVSQAPLGGVPMAASAGGYSYSDYSSDQQAITALVAIENQTGNQPLGSPVPIQLTANQKASLYNNPQADSTTILWNEGGWRYMVNNSVVASPSAVEATSNQVIATMKQFKGYPPFSYGGYIEDVSLPTMAPVGMTWTDGTQLLSIGVDNGSLAQTWASALSIAAVTSG